MSIPREIESYLRQEDAEYEVIGHPTAYTTQEDAAATHISGYEWAKTVIFFTDEGEPIMAVVPAPYRVEIDGLKQLAGANDLHLAEEAEFAGLYPGCEPGAMPPFGPLFGQRVFVEERLAQDERVVFNAGTHRDAIRMRYSEFERLARPTLGHFANLPGAAR